MLAQGTGWFLFRFFPQLVSRQKLMWLWLFKHIAFQSSYVRINLAKTVQN
jgi:hypothetical protein